MHGNVDGARAYLFVIAAVIALGGCAVPPRTAPSVDTPVAAPPSVPPGSPEPVRSRLATQPTRLADDLVADENALRDPASTGATLVAAARRQQVAYRAIGRHPEWDAEVRSRIPAPLIEVYDRNVDARRRLDAMAHPKDTLPAWRISAPAPAEELLADYREAESTFGVGWNYLAAINLIETRFGSIDGVSTAGAQGPMQFMPPTFAAYGAGGDVHSPHDSIMAAGRYLAANGFAANRDRAIYRYDNSTDYVGAVNDYAAILAAEPAALQWFHRWDVYYTTTSGDVLLPVGYVASAPIPVAEYLASHPQ